MKTNMLFNLYRELYYCVMSSNKWKYGKDMEYELSKGHLVGRPYDGGIRFTYIECETDPLAAKRKWYIGK